jgi:hypothetical protein
MGNNVLPERAADGDAQNRGGGAPERREKGRVARLAIPAKKITHSDAMSITLGAKRRWRRLCWPD